uniref:thiol oxidase n=1 Tax=viral metagenome TaxID=1070528 RepID=A0A6C0LSC6_9ZZZZ
MTTCNIKDTDSRNNGLITKIWGSAGWILNHSITFGYPSNPTDEDKHRYKMYFISLGDVLPCKYCRESYKKFIIQGETALTDNVMKNRETLTTWFYKIHNAVNNKLGIDYGITYDDLVEKMESFRAKCGNSKSCIIPLDYKAFSYRKLDQKDCPIIKFKDVQIFFTLAKLRGVEDKYYSFYQFIESLNGDISLLKKSKIWIHRNKFCQKQIKKMRENGKPSTEIDGLWIGTPTIDELKLLLHLCSNLNRDEIQICNKIIIENPIYNTFINSEN